jgi:translocation protein SEC72
MADSFLLLPLKWDEKTKSVVCSNHSLPTCLKCNLDFTSLNLLHRNFNSLPQEAQAPPAPNQTPHPARSAQIAKLKDSANTAFKSQRFKEAVRLYSLGIEMALTRPPWEPAAICRDEAVLLLCSRSAARFALKEFPESFTDAEGVVKLKKTWAKGYFRAAKALQAMGRLAEANKAIKAGLLYDSNDNDCNLALKDISKALEEQG